MSDDENEENEQEPYKITYTGETVAKLHVGVDGTAKATFPNGDSFSGEYKSQKRNGKGEYTWKKPKAAYVGTYVDGKRQGMGKMTYPDGSMYHGSWENNDRHGFGTYIFANGDRYCGAWVNNIRSGKGTYLYAASQTQLSGTFVNGECIDGAWEYYDKKAFVCQWKDGYIARYGDRRLA